MVDPDDAFFRVCGSLCAAFSGGIDMVAGVLMAELLLLLVMLLTLGLDCSVSRLDGAWNDDISSCAQELISKIT